MRVFPNNTPLSASPQHFAASCTARPRPWHIRGDMATSTARVKDEKPGGFATNLASVFFCGALAQGVAYPLGLDAAAALALGIQFLAWIPSALKKNETFYDLTGMLTFMAVTAFSVAGFLRSFFEAEMTQLSSAFEKEVPQRIKASLVAIVADAPRHLIAAALVLIWTTRLGTFLFARIRRDGHDSRFDGVRDKPLLFLLFWCVQGLWVFFTPLPMLALHKADPKGGMGSVYVQDAIGLAIWAAGFALEVVADSQKRVFKGKPANSGKFIDVGLWSRCRHPNYLGEMVIWLGFFIFCSRGVVGGPGWLTLIGPLFVAALLVFISTPTLESGADKKYGGQAAYQEYKRKTPCLFLRVW